MGLELHAGKVNVQTVVDKGKRKGLRPGRSWSEPRLPLIIAGIITTPDLKAP